MRSHVYAENAQQTVRHIFTVPCDAPGGPAHFRGDTRSITVTAKISLVNPCRPGDRSMPFVFRSHLFPIAVEEDNILRREKLLQRPATFEPVTAIETLHVFPRARSCGLAIRVDVWDLDTVPGGVLVHVEEISKAHARVAVPGEHRVDGTILLIAVILDTARIDPDPIEPALLGQMDRPTQPWPYQCCRCKLRSCHFGLELAVAS